MSLTSQCSTTKSRSDRPPVGMQVTDQMSSHSSSTLSPLRAGPEEEGPKVAGLLEVWGRSFVSRRDNPPIRVTAHTTSSGVTEEAETHETREKKQKKNSPAFPVKTQSYQLTSWRSRGSSSSSLRQDSCQRCHNVEPDLHLHSEPKQCDS